MGVHVLGSERPAGAVGIGHAVRRCLCPARCPYAAAHRGGRPVTESLARALMDLLPGDPGLALDLVWDLCVAGGG